MIEEAGLAAYVTKPVKQSQLFDRLITALGSARDSKQAAEKHDQTPPPG